MNLTPAELQFLAWSVRVAEQVVPSNHPARERIPSNIPSILARLEATSANGTPEPPECETEWHEQWATTAEAAAALGTSERWARDIATRLGGVKRGGRWWIPWDALPEPDIED